MKQQERKKAKIELKPESLITKNAVHTLLATDLATLSNTIITANRMCKYKYTFCVIGQFQVDCNPATLASNVDHSVS